MVFAVIINFRHRFIMARLELVETLKAHDGRTWNVAWHPKGNILASCGEDKIICLWGKDCLGKWQCKIKLTEGHTRAIREINWSPCGNYLGKTSFANHFLSMLFLKTSYFSFSQF